MPITRLKIKGFRRFCNFELEFGPAFNVLAGNNETGKSSLLEAIAIVLTGQYDGRLVQYALDPYLFNAAQVTQYFSSVRAGTNAPAPSVLIEAYLAPNDNEPAIARLRGTNNSRNEDCPGLALSIELDSSHIEDLKGYASDSSNPSVVPVEYYQATWRSFSGGNVSLRHLPVRASIIDTTRVRSVWGPTKYLSRVVQDALTEPQRQQLSLEYKRLQHVFAQEPGVQAINAHLARYGNPVTAKTLTVQMDLSSQASWNNAMTAHLDDLPFHCAGKGEQSRIQLRLAIFGEDRSQVLLIEEPENHLSHSNLNMLLEDIRKDTASRQVIATTHSAFVLNKLGLDNLRLLSHDGSSATLEALPSDTKDYFMKLPGYDTLRLILSRSCILVEGPSDELIVQRAFKDKHGAMPLQRGVDVISVGALAFRRFLHIAARLQLDVRVVTDNDGDVPSLEAKYAEYLQPGSSTIRICYDRDEAFPSLEPQLLKANSLDLLNTILGTRHSDAPALLAYMRRNKTECALKLFSSDLPWKAPEYITDAII